MICRRDRQPKRRHGAVAVVVTLCLVPLIGIMALAVDGGLMLAAKRRSQTVADASALAAAIRLYANSLTTDPSGLDVGGNAKEAVLTIAAANGYSNDGTTNTVKVNFSPSITDSTFNKPFYAEVIVTTIQPRIFGAILGSGSSTIGARSIARGTTGFPSPYTTASIVALDANKPGALSVSGGVNLSADSPIQVDSSSSSAFAATGGVIVTAPAIQTVGGYSKALGTIVSPVSTGAPYIADPLASLAVPDPATLAQRSNTATYGNVTLQPGVYSGGLNLGGGMNVTLQPGVYYFRGGDLNVGNGVNLSGSGVTIYMEGAGKLNFGGGANVNLTPPTSGSTAGLSVFVDRTSTTPITLGNGANINFGGTFYAKSAPVTILGGSNVHAGSQVIVDSFGVSNGVNLAFTTASDAKKGYVASRSNTPSITIVE